MLGLGLALSLATALAMAQTGANTGLKGRVMDQSGASIPGAAVTLVRVETGERRVVTTSEEGDWEARFLDPGNLSAHPRANRFQEAGPGWTLGVDRRDGHRQRRAASG